MTDAFATIDRIFIINLPERSDRRRQMDKQLRKLGLSLQSDKVELFAAIKPDAVLDWPSLGARGCFMSHYQIIRLAQERNYKTVLILEDDCDFVDDFMRHWQSLGSQLSQRDWGMAYPGHILKLDATPSAHWQERQASIGLTHCYLLNHLAVPSLLEFLDDVLARPAGHPLGGPQHYDGALNTFYFQYPEIRVMVANPSLAFQRRSKSDVTTGRFDSIPVIAWVMSLLRALRYRATGK